jgi:beta-carotene hydroxylase
MDQLALAAARQHMGKFAVPTVIFAVAVLATYAATVALTLAGTLPLLAAVPVAAVLTYLSYTVLHEAAHGNISGSNPSLRKLNDALGYMAGWILMIPLTAHRHEHLAHHRSTNNPDGDPDFVMAKFLDSPSNFFRTAPKVFWTQFGYYRANRWGRGDRSQDFKLCLEVVAILLPRLALFAAGFTAEGIALFLVAWLIGVSLVIYLFAYLVHRPHEAVGRYVDTSTILVNGPLGKLVTWLWVYQNYHSIHHLFPRVPFYRYPELFEEIEETMVAKGAPIYRLGTRGLQPRIAATASL